MKFRYAALFGLYLFVQQSYAQTEADSDQGKRLYNRSCMTCHGRQAEKNAMQQSAVVQNMKKDEIIAALQARKKGEIKGPGNAAKERLSDEDMRNIAAYIESLKK